MFAVFDGLLCSTKFLIAIYFQIVHENFGNFEGWSFCKQVLTFLPKIHPYLKMHHLWRRCKDLTMQYRPHSQ